MTKSIYRGMTREALDRGYNNVLDDPDYETRIAGFKERSAALYHETEVARDRAYGGSPRQRFDWVSCGRLEAPTFVFIHGGYWQNYAKEDLAFVAAGPLALGFNVVLAEYTLAPEAAMTEIVGEIELLLNYLQTGDNEIGFGDRPVCLCGHSAGGQLATLHRSHPAVTMTLAVSGLFDLEPIALSWLNDKLRLTPEEVSAFSPIRKIVPGGPAIVAVGGAELPELVRQSHDYVAALTRCNENNVFMTLDGHSHFSILDELADPDSSMTATIARILALARRS